MDFNDLKEWMTLENIYDLIHEYRSLGPLPGILLPMLEAFLPFLPLVVFVLANANAFGLWLGFLVSWIGSCAGALLVFWLVRKYGQGKVLSFFQKHRQFQRLMDWVDRHGFGPLFLMLCFPFTPSAMVNIVAGLSHISPLQYGLAVLAGKMVMVFSISFVGYDLASLVHKPLRTVIVLSVIFLLWFIGKRIEARLNKSVSRDNG
ncbi:putative membrane protein YdjX (TVP38/TMEM64 family) [Peribacillus deserti]|uniref:TVP38/TMEM64 family membrane protein n=1 Tax=Peribacillus deserti TaxID=673318 RepID=A0ABS2QLF9_9BACI|nr:TVP38/TMEM64 family protein [Peribacillus deserti]MBM7694010.1 putative membrane protein YdjX (TVP38/TMEM64 family) [Peribacillus deserti]